VIDQPPPGSALTGTDMLSLIARIDDMLGKMEGRIMDRLGDNASAAAERWKLHDIASERTISGIRAEVAILRADLIEHLRIANLHFDKEEHDQIILDARVKPVKTTVQWLVSNWPKVLALLFGILGFLALLGDWAERYLGGIGS